MAGDPSARASASRRPRMPALCRPMARAAVTTPGCSNSSSSRAVSGGGQSRARAQESRTSRRAGGQGALTSSCRGGSPTARTAASRVRARVPPIRAGQGRASNWPPSIQPLPPTPCNDCQASRARGSTPNAQPTPMLSGNRAATASTISRARTPTPARPPPARLSPSRRGISQRRRSRPRPVSRASITASNNQSPVHNSWNSSDCSVSLRSVPRPPRPNTPSRVALRRAHSSR